jgi:hypothetical protein
MGVWIRFKQESGLRADERWLSITREWLLDLRTQLKEAWVAQYGNKVPLGATPRAWVLSQLEKMGVRLNGDEAIYLPSVLYLRISVAKDVDSRGPGEEWDVHESILPSRLGPGQVGKKRP